VGSAHRSVELLAALLSSLLLGIMFGGLAVTLGQDELKGSRKKDGLKYKPSTRLIGPLKMLQQQASSLQLILKNLGNSVSRARFLTY
jgi:hypothetical protein